MGHIFESIKAIGRVATMGLDRSEYLEAVVIPPLGRSQVGKTCIFGRLLHISAPILERGIFHSFLSGKRHIFSIRNKAVHFFYSSFFPAMASFLLGRKSVQGVFFCLACNWSWRRKRGG